MCPLFNNSCINCNINMLCGIKVMVYFQGSGIEKQLSDAGGRYTVFAPDNNVFNKLLPGTVAYLKSDEVVQFIYRYSWIIIITQV